MNYPYSFAHYDYGFGTRSFGLPFSTTAYLAYH